jgi:outer membrane protein assembly factor BamB
MAVRTRFFLAAALVSTTLVVAVGPSGAATQGRPTAAASVDWPQYHGEPAHQGLNRAEDLVGPDNVAQLSLSWIGNGATSAEDLVFRSSPTVVDGYVYFGTDAGQLLAFPAHCQSDCQPAWRVQLGEGVYNTPAVVDGILYIGTASSLGHLYAFDVAKCAARGGNCAPLWTASLAIGDSSPTVVDGVVYVGSQFDNVYAFAADGCGKTTCKPLWVGHTDGFVLNSPAVANGVVYAGDSTGYLYAFAATGCGQAQPGPTVPPTCTALWRGRAANPIYAASPVVHGGMVYTTSFAASPDSFLEVFAAGGCGKAVCKPVWRGVGGDYMDSAPAVAYGRVYLGSGDGVLRVYPAKGCGDPTCAALWTGFGPGPVAAVDSPPMVANGVVYIGMEQRVRAFAARGCGQSQCQSLWEFITQDPIVNSSPVMVNDTLYFSGTNFGAVPELYVFNLP